MDTRIHKLLAAGLMASVFTVAPLHAQDSGGESGSASGSASGQADAGGTGDSGGTEAGGSAAGDGETDAGGNTDTGGAEADTDAGAGADVEAPGDEPADIGAVGAPESGGMPTDVEITPEQETRVREIIVQEAPAPATVDFEVATGVTVPDTVTLQPVPPTVVEIVPAYESYQYFTLEDGRVVIVDPVSLEIVYVVQ